MSTVNSGIKNRLQQIWLIRALDITFLTVALLSLLYAVVTAPGNGIDFFTYYVGASEWAAGSYGSNTYFPYPPFVFPLLAPFTFLPFAIALLVWLGINLVATGLCVNFIFRYFENWSVRV